jgi:hypothetical protein
MTSCALLTLTELPAYFGLLISISVVCDPETFCQITDVATGLDVIILVNVMSLPNTTDIEPPLINTVGSSEKHKALGMANNTNN